MDLWRSLVQPSAQSRLSYEARPSCSGVYSPCYNLFQCLIHGWEAGAITRIFGFLDHGEVYSATWPHGCQCVTPVPKGDCLGVGKAHRGGFKLGMNWDGNEMRLNRDEHRGSSPRVGGEGNGITEVHLYQCMQHGQQIGGAGRKPFCKRKLT